MLTRHLKLRPYKAQEQVFNDWLHILTGVYNWVIRQIKLNAGNKIYPDAFKLNNLTQGHAKRIGVHSQVLQGMIKQAWTAWNRCFKKISKEPRLKGFTNRLNSIPFPQLTKFHQPHGNRIQLPGIGEVRFFKQDIPEGKIKTGRIIKKASGWYLEITIDTAYKPKKSVKSSDSKIGIDTGFKDISILSDGTRYENPRELRKGAVRLAQAQRGNHKKLAARLQERLANQRKDRNHKISHDIVQKHKEIFITNDNLRGQAKRFGKSVSEAGISQLRQFILYKGKSCGRVVSLVDSKHSTMTCSSCLALTGPTGLDGLAVREWVCAACGAAHDRDINAAVNTLISGLGYNLVSPPSNDVGEVNQKPCQALEVLDPTPFTG